MNRAKGLVSLGLVLAGCGDPLLEPQRIERPRLLGARVEVDGDPERATPAPGETVTVRWLVTAPRGPVASSWGFVACELEDDLSSDPPECAAPPFDAALAVEPVAGEPRFTFTLPPAASFERLGVLGGVCAFGRSSVLEDGELDCAGEGSRALPASYDARIGQDDVNANPSLAGAAPRFDGQPWPEPAAESVPGGPCDPVAPRLSLADRRARVELDLDAGQREPIPVMDVGPERETLQLSLASTAGRLEEPYVVVLPDDTRERVPVAMDWEGPHSAAGGGEIVRFYFVLRDLRGGADWIERDVCVVP